MLSFRGWLDQGGGGQWRGTLHSPKLQHYWSHTIRLFIVISRTLAEGVVSFCRDAVDVFYSPSRLSNLSYELDVIQGQFISNVKLVWNQFSFSKIDCLTIPLQLNARKFMEWKGELMPFLRIFAQIAKQAGSSKIWTLIDDSISLRRREIINWIFGSLWVYICVRVRVCMKKKERKKEINIDTIKFSLYPGAHSQKILTHIHTHTHARTYIHTLDICFSVVFKSCLIRIVCILVLWVCQERDRSQETVWKERWRE